MAGTLVSHHSHRGAFSAVVEGGRVVGAVPFALDPDPSPLIAAIPDAVHSPTRIVAPMVRSGWLDGGRATGAGRGREPFVAVSGERALEARPGPECARAVNPPPVTAFVPPREHPAGAAA